MLRTSAISCLRFEASFPYAPDWLFWMGVLEIGGLYLVRENLAGFRRHESQTTEYLRCSEIESKLLTVKEIAVRGIEAGILTEATANYGNFLYSMKIFHYTIKNRFSIGDSLYAFKQVINNFSLTNYVRWLKRHR